MTLLWLAGCLALAALSVAIAWPSYQSRRRRQRTHDNAQRYLGWRGRAARVPASPLDAYQAEREGRRFVIAGVLGVGAVAGLVALLVAG